MELILDHCVERIRAAAASGTPLRIRGGGSKDFYGEPPQGELLETAPLAGITSYEPSELVVTARAGTPLAELEAAAGRAGPVPAVRAAALRRRRHRRRHGGRGPERPGARQRRLGARLCAGRRRMINGRGELLTFGGQVMKNVAGYDVSRLVAGSLGTLGLIAEVSLKVLPVAPAEATLKFEMTPGRSAAPPE